MKLLKTLLFLSLIITLLDSCVKEVISLDDLTQETALTPSLAIPIGEVTMSLADAEDIVNSDIVSYNANTGLYELISHTELFDYPAASLLSIEDQAFNKTMTLHPASALAINSAAMGDNVTLPDFDADFSMNMNNGEVIDSIKVNTGSINITVTSEIKHDFNIEINLPGLKLNGTSYQNNIHLPYEGATPFGNSIIIDLAGYTLDFTNGVDDNSFPLQAIITLTHTGELTTEDDALIFDISFEINEYEYAYGYFGQYTDVLQLDSAAVDFSNDLEGAEVYISDPRIELTIENSTGISLEIDFLSILADNNGTNVSLGGSHLTSIPIIAAAINPSDTAITQHLIDNSGTSPSLSEALDSDPSYLIYTATATTNPSGPVHNFILNTSHVKCYADVIIPAFGYADNISLNDTIDLDIAELVKDDDSTDGINYEDVESATIRLFMENGLAIRSGIKAYFTDSTNVVIDSVFFQDDYQYFLEPGFVDFSLSPSDSDYGKVLNPTTSVTDISLSSEKIKQLIENNSTKLILAAVAYTNMADSNEEVKFYPEDYIRIKVSAKVDFSINLSE